jgi:hypothetical protein
MPKALTLINKVLGSYYTSTIKLLSTYYATVIQIRTVTSEPSYNPYTNTSAQSTIQSTTKSNEPLEIKINPLTSNGQTHVSTVALNGYRYLEYNP